MKNNKNENKNENKDEDGIKIEKIFLLQFEKNNESYKDSPCAIATIPGMSLTSNSKKASIPSSS